MNFHLDLATKSPGYSCDFEYVEGTHLAAFIRLVDEAYPWTRLKKTHEVLEDQERNLEKLGF